MALAKIRSGQPILHGASVISPSASPAGFTREETGYEEAQPSGFIAETLHARFLAGQWASPDALPAASGDVKSASSGSDAILHYPAEPGRRQVFKGVAWDYATTPTAGMVTIESPSGVVLFQQDVTAAGPGFFPFPGGLRGPIGELSRVVLKDGSASKKISLLGRTVE